MGGQQTKEEEVIIAQTSSGGDNRANVDQLMNSVSTTQVLLIVVCVVVCVFALIAFYRLYHKYHTQMIQGEINQFMMRRTGSFFRRQRAAEAAESGV